MATLQDAKELAAALAAPFPADVLGWKVQTVTKDGNRCLAVPYLDARDIQDRLDEVLGIDGWADEYLVLPCHAVQCRLSVKIAGAWVTKADVGGESDQPDAGDKTKSAHSDAHKRAAVKFGIGRYLYRLPAAWVDYDQQRKQPAKTPSLPAWALPSEPPSLLERSRSALRSAKTASELADAWKALDQRTLTKEQLQELMALKDERKAALS